VILELMILYEYLQLLWHICAMSMFVEVCVRELACLYF
jgi:hypothetical protein